MPVKINGASSGSVTLAAPSSGSDVTVTLPGAAGTVALTASPTLSSPTFTGTVSWAASVLPASPGSVATSQSTSSTTYADLATTGPAVTVTTGTKALVLFGAYMYGSSTNSVYCSVAVSGATTTAASDSWAIVHDSATANYGGTRFSAYMFTGLTAGSNTFTMKYRTTSSTATFSTRYIVVVDMGS